MSRSKFKNLQAALIAVLVLGLSIGFTGCGDDESPVTVPTTGSISVDVTPDDIGVSWVLSSQDKIFASVQGDSTFSSLAPGSYTLTWGKATGWNSPVPGTVDITLQAGDVLSYSGTYEVGIPDGFVEVAPGSFTMGAPESELGRDGDEVEHAVTLTQGFMMSEYEVTEAMWDEYMGGSSVSQMPKTGVSWDMAVEFCNAMSVAEGFTPAYAINGSGDVTWNRNANGFRLPTEAEWEYACRGGSDGAFPGGQISALFCDEDSNLDAVGWYCFNSGSAAHEVGAKYPNNFGLYDMNGNVWEWCWDAYTHDYQDLGSTDPVLDGGAGESRVVRSGGYSSYSHFCRAAARSKAAPTLAHTLYGFRVVKTMP